MLTCRLAYAYPTLNEKASPDKSRRDQSNNKTSPHQIGYREKLLYNQPAETHALVIDLFAWERETRQGRTGG